VAALVAAGFTLLQRSAPLVRALSGGRSGILLPLSPPFLTALAASDGRGAVLLPPNVGAEALASSIQQAGVRAVFTTTGLQQFIPEDIPRVLLDEAPAYAIVSVDGSVTRVDLGSHFGLTLEGDSEAPGRDEACIVYPVRDVSGAYGETVLTHRHLIAEGVVLTRGARTARGTGSAGGAHAPGSIPHLGSRMWTHHPASSPSALIESFVAPLLAGGHLRTSGHSKN
jgi:hypothetical protein